AVGLLALGFGVFAVASIATTAFFVALVVQVVLLRRIWRELDDPQPLSFATEDIIALGRESLPFFWIALAIVVYQQVDVIIISLVVEDDAVLGWYSVYERLAGTLLFVPTVFMTAVFPTISRLYADPETDTGAGGLSSRIIQKSFTSMLLVSIPLGFGAAAVSKPLVVLLFGSGFADAAPIVFVGGFVLSLTYQTTILGMFLIAMDKQRQWTMFIVLGALLTIPLDLVLVPFFDANYQNGAIGAVLGFLITESIVLAGAIYLLPRGSLDRSSALFAVRAIVAGAVMAGAVMLVIGINLPITILVGALTYGLMVSLLRLVTSEDRQVIRNQLRRATRADA
ncbi:MAG: oligosaccharide flippase family protein, partial [Acidimicrobiales bacterium]